MSLVRTVYQCDMCQRQYTATSSDPAPRPLSLLLGGTCIRMATHARGNPKGGEVCNTCVAKLKRLLGAAWDALEVEEGGDS